jgi:hypothetical protein
MFYGENANIAGINAGYAVKGYVHIIEYFYLHGK